MYLFFHLTPVLMLLEQEALIGCGSANADVQVSARSEQAVIKQLLELTGWRKSEALDGTS